MTPETIQSLASLIVSVGLVVAMILLFAGDTIVSIIRALKGQSQSDNEEDEE